MVQINFAQKEIQCKIVYYGPGMSGKTTNLELVHGKVPEDARGELTSIATTGERTLYFDYMPLDLGQIAGIRTKFQLYTVPGQIYYKSTRRLVLQGVDGIVFVADSSAAKMKENKESWADLEENLAEMGKSLKDVPVIIQYNKRDLPDALPMADLERELNPSGFASYEAVATRGEGVFPTLKTLAGKVLEMVNKGGLSGTRTREAPSPVSVSAGSAQAPEPVLAAAAPQASAVGLPPAPVPTHLPDSPVAGPPPPTPAATRSAPPPAPVSPVSLPSAPQAAPVPDRPAPPPPATPEMADRAFAERVVKVQGLSGSDRSGRVAVMVALFALIAGALVFAVSKFV